MVFCAYAVDPGHFQNVSFFGFHGSKFVAFFALSSVLGKPTSYVSSGFQPFRPADALAFSSSDSGLERTQI